MATTEDRFWARVDKSGDTGCWLWTGSRTKAVNGYGQLKVDRKRIVAHRRAYELLVGPIPAGLELDHLCRVRLCVNPAHLEPVTPYENFLRGASPLAAQVRQTHCKRGHPLTPDNVSIANGGRSRRCKTCKRIDTNARRARAREAA